MRKTLDHFALLLRLDPKRWPVWNTRIHDDKDSSVWWTTGRRPPETIHPGIPVFVLGTRGLGIVAQGETSTGVECISDPDWKEVSADFKEECRAPMNRVQTFVRRAEIPLAELQDQPVTAKLHLRRETTTWLTSSQYEALTSMLP